MNQNNSPVFSGYWLGAINQISKNDGAHRRKMIKLFEKEYKKYVDTWYSAKYFYLNI